MNHNDDIFRTDGSPGEQTFESAVDDAIAFFETAFAAAENWYGQRTSGVEGARVERTRGTQGSED